MKEVKIPSVSRLSFLSNLPAFAAGPLPILEKYVAKHGDFFQFPFGEDGGAAYVSTNPEINQYVLQKNHRNYRKSILQTEVLARYLGKGLLTIDGAYWLQQRRLIQPGFHRNKLQALVEIMHVVMDEFLEELSSYEKSRQEVDLHE